MQSFDYLDLGGGINAGADPSDIPSREFPELTNFYPFETRARRRGGSRRITRAARVIEGETDTILPGGQWSAAITGMLPYKPNDNSVGWVLLLAPSSGSAFGKLNGDEVADIPYPEIVIPDSDLPWSMFQYKGFAYALRRNGGGLVRLDASVARRAGIAAPSAAPTMASGAAGALPAGTYRGVYTYYNRATALESNPSPEGSVTIGANGSINWSGITASSNGFVDARRIYRSLENQVGVYFFVAEIPNNTSTTYTGDQVVTADLGRTVSFRNGLPNALLENGVVWNERLFASDGVDLHFSELLLVECFGEENVIPVFPDDGHKIRALHAFGDRLIIGKSNKVHYLIGTNRTNFAVQTLSDRHGCMSHASMQSAEGTLFWYGSGNAVFRSDGTSVREISTPKIRTILETIPADREEFIVATIFPKHRWYVLIIPRSPDEESFGQSQTRILVYNYRTDAWTEFTHPGSAPSFMTEMFDENYGSVLYGTQRDGHVYELYNPNYLYDDFSLSPFQVDGSDSPFTSQIEAELLTKLDDFGYPGFGKFLDEVHLLVPTVNPSTLRLRAYRNGSTTPRKDRTINLLGATGETDWQKFKLSTAGTPGTRWQVRITYTGVPAIDLDGLRFVVGLKQRTGRGQPR